MKTALDRFVDFIIFDSVDGCWEWDGSIHRDGYTFFKVDGYNRYAHIVSYEMFVGRIPDGYEIDHLCNRRHCVNPDHLEPVTPLVNARRRSGWKFIDCKWYCKEGHLVEGWNLQQNGKGVLCRTCSNHRQKLAQRRRARDRT